MENKDNVTLLELNMPVEEFKEKEYIKIDDVVYIRRDKSEKLLTEFVEKLINEGKLQIAPGHADFFKALNLTTDTDVRSIREIAKTEFDKHAGSNKDNAIAWHWWKRAFDVASSIFKK